MALQKKYYYYYTGLDGKTYDVEIWQNIGSVIVAEEVTGGNNPFKVELPELEHKFQVVRGKGCAIEIFSDVDMKFYNGLYHVDPQEFVVVQFINSNIDYIGYLNSEIYSEPYDKSKYTISVTGADGFSLMDRFSFLQLDGSNYTGIKSMWDILKIVLGKIGLPWNEILVSLSTTFPGYSAAADRTILHELYIDCSNFYDEDNEAMTLREVVESILAPYGATIEAESGNIYIKDIHTLAAGGSITYKRFNASTYAYIADVVELNEKSISSVKYAGTGQRIERSGGVNKQVVSYSCYPIKVAVPESIIGLTEFQTVPDLYSIKNGYFYKTITDNVVLQEYSPATFEISYYNDENDANIYLRIPYLANNQKVADLINQPFMTISGAKTVVSGYSSSGRIRRKYYEGVAIKITGEILPKTKSNPYDNSLTSMPLISVTLKFKLKIGDKYYLNNMSGWQTTDTTFDIRTITESYSIKPDVFTEMGIYSNEFMAIIGNLSEDIVLSGNLQLEIWSDYDIEYVYPVYNGNDALVDEVWLRNLKIEIVNLDGTEISDIDIEYVGLLDNRFQNEGETIVLNTGTDSIYADRAKIMKYNGVDYLSVREWTRAGQTFRVEELLLGSLSSNYRAGFVSLNGMKLRNNFKLRNVLNDTYIPGKKMMVKSGTIDYRNNRIECDLVEISQDELIIET